MKDFNTEKTIFAGSEAYKLISKSLESCHSLPTILHGEIKIIKSTMLEPNHLVTCDPELVEALKELEKKEKGI